MKPIAVLTADMHLQDKVWANRDTLVGDAFFAAHFLGDFAALRKVPLIAAGDLLDERRNYSSPIYQLTRWLDSLAEAQTPFWFVQGQHELQAAPWLNAVHSWPLWLDVAGLESLGKYKLLGRDWRTAPELQAILEDDPLVRKADILVLHQVCDEFMGGVTTPELFWNQIPGNVKVLLVGDYHKHVCLRRNNRDAKEMLVLSPGSTCMQSIDEEPVKQFFILYDDLSVESREIPSRPYLCPLQVAFAETLDQVVASLPGELEGLAKAAEEQGLPPELRTPIVRIHYDPTLPEAFSRLTKAVGDLGHLFLKEHWPPREGDDRQRTEDSREIRLRGMDAALSQFCDEETEPQVFALVHELLHGDPVEVLHRKRIEFGVTQSITE